MTSPRHLLRAALAEKGLTNTQLRDGSDLKCTVPSVNRKLNGLQSITVDEATRMGRTLDVKIPGLDECRKLERRLGVTIVWAPERKRAA